MLTFVDLWTGNNYMLGYVRCSYVRLNIVHLKHLVHLVLF